MVYSINRVELSLDCNSDRFSKLQNKAYDADYNLENDGIEIDCRDSTYKKKIKLVVNPTTLLGGHDPTKLWKPNEDSIQKLLRKIDKHIDRCFGSKYSLDDFTLTGIDFTVNIDIGDRNTVAAYIKVLQNIGKVKGFSPMQYKDYTHFNDDNSFGLAGNSNGIEFVAYDREAVSKCKDSRGILSVGVRLGKQKTIRKYADATVTSQQLGGLASNSKDIFLDTFIHVVPYGDFVKKKDAVRIIEGSGLKRKSKSKMLRLLELIPKKKSILLAQKAMGERDIEKIMKMFYELNISPVTISKRQDVNYLETLYLHLLDG